MNLSPTFPDRQPSAAAFDLSVVNDLADPNILAKDLHLLILSFSRL